MNFSRCRLVAVLLLCLAVQGLCSAARTLHLPFAPTAEAFDTAVAPVDSTDTIGVHTAAQVETLQQMMLPADTAALRPSALKPNEVQKAVQTLQTAGKKQFLPDPQRALWLSLILPGAGQIYNRKYWKLPLVYGGFLGCTYAFLWNQQMYMDYSQAYLDIMDDDPTTNSFRNMFPPGYDLNSNLDRFKTIFKNRKDRYRRYRDLSAFCFVGVYLLSVIDAYVDAQLSVFDISPDLSLRVAPALIETNNGRSPLPAMGLGATFTF